MDNLRKQADMDNPSERWAPIPDAPGYEVSDLGHVRSVDRRVAHMRGSIFTRRVKGRMIAMSYDTFGRARVRIRTAVGYRTRLVHRLMLAAFVGPPPEGMVACHNNGDATDNRLVNLRWDTLSSNTTDSVIHETHANSQKTHCKRGHEFTPENTAVARNGWRRCRTCARAAKNAFMARARARRTA